MTVLPYLKAKVLKIIVINVEPLKNQGQIVLIYFKAIHLIPHSFGMPSGFVRDFANNGSFFRKRDSKLSTYPSYTLNIPFGLLERYFIVPSGLLESIFLLASFLLPSSYPLFCIYQKNIFHTIYHKFRTFNFQVQRLSTANCELQYTLHRTFLEATPLLPSCYPLTIPSLSLRSISE